MSQIIDVQVPDIGDFKDVEVIEVLIKPGDNIAKEQSLITVESDKASMEIPSPAAGIVKEVRVKLGDKVSQGSPLIRLESGAAAASAPASAGASVTATARSRRRRRMFRQMPTPKNATSRTPRMVAPRPSQSAWTFASI